MKTGAPLPVGQLLDGRYRIHKLLGIGGMGRVYLANDTRLANRPAAVKEMIVGDGAQERKAIEDFHREASVLARLTHPSIPQIIDYFGEQGRHYLVMEYVAGGDLQHRLDEMGDGSRMRETEVVEMASQLLDVLQFLHSQKPPIIYRDFKPANVMIDHNGRAMLIDFGIARFLPRGGRGTQIGSVGYAPPEQYLGKLEPRSDLYALAATMHHLLTGRDPQLQPPFSFPPLKELAPEISSQTAQVVMAALDKDINRRPASALAMRDSLPKLAAPRAVSTTTARDSVKARRAVSATETVVLDSSAVPSSSATPRSLPRTPISTPIASVKPGAPSSTQSHDIDSKIDKANVPIALSTSATRVGIKPQLQVPARESGSVSSKSKTADFGLKMPPKLSSNANIATNPPRSSGRARSRMAAALASVRAAVTAGSPSSDTPARPGLAGWPSSPTMSHEAVPGQFAKPNTIGHSSNGKPDYTPPSLDDGARLVSTLDGVQFKVLGNRLVLGRANTKDEGIDINLSCLRRGADRISRRHAEIIRQGNDYFVRDLGSVNGTYIVGRGRLGRDQLYKLKDRDELVLGGAKLEFRRG